MVVHLNRGTGALPVTIEFLVTSLTKALLLRLLSLVGRSALGRVLLVPNVFHLRMMEATVFLGTFNAAEMFWYPFPDLCLDTIDTKNFSDWESHRVAHNWPSVVWVWPG